MNTYSDIAQNGQETKPVLTDEMEHELEKKRSELNSEAEKHRRERDKLNDKAREWIEKRDGLNTRAKELAEQAAECKKLRDEYNVEVRQAKEQRDIWNRNYHKLEDQLDKLKRKKTPIDMASPARLKKELKGLEFKQMTSVLSPADEKQLIERMSKIQKEIKKIEQMLEKDSEIINLTDEIRSAYNEAEKFHRTDEDFAEKAQQDHDMMVDLFEQSDKVRKEADGAQENFISAKLAADEEHRKHVELIKQVHDYDKMITGIRQKDKMSKRVKDEDVAKKQAEEIYSKFKAGEKLSTDDLMALQKAGYL